MPRRKPPKELCMEFAWLDGWLCDLKDAVERSILKAKPNVSPDRLVKLSAVDCIRHGKYHWVMIVGQIRFAVRNEDGVIFGVEEDVIRRGRAYGKVGEWEQWDWEANPPSRLQDQTAPSNEGRAFADDGKPTEPTEGQPHHEIEQPPRLDAECEATLDQAAERVRREGERKRLEEKFGWGPGDVTINSKEEFLRRTSEGSRIDRVIVADLGVEGGGATIFGRIIGDRWVFRQGGSSIALDADDNEEWRTWESDSAADLSAVVPTNWPLMYPIKVHPEFVDWFRDHYEAARASLRDDLRAYQARSPHGDWRKVFGETGNP